MGRVDPEKKVGVVIEAFARVHGEVPNALMLVVGDGVDKTRLIAMVKKMKLDDSVKFLGRIVPPELYEIYRMGTVFATASEIETQGIVLIEAAASGLPLIAVDKGAVSEICVTGKNGFLCEPGDVSEIAEAMGKLLTDKKLQKEYAETSIKLAHEHDFEKTLDKFLNIYQKVVKDKKKT